MTFDLQPTAEEVGNQIQAIYNEVQQGLARLADSAHFADSAQPLVSGWVAVAEGIANNVTELSEHHSGDGYHDDILSLEEEVERANQIADEAVSLRELSLSLNGQAENLIGGLGYLFDDINITSSSLEAVNEELQTVQTSLEESADELSHLIDDVSSINDVIARANSEIESSNEAILSSNLTSLCDAIDDLATWIGTETPAMSGSGVGPLTPELDDGIGLEASGSGMTLAPDSLTGTAALFSETVGEVGVAVDVCGGVVSGATNHSLSLQDQAEAICRSLFVFSLSFPFFLSLSHTHTLAPLYISHTLSHTLSHSQSPDRESGVWWCSCRGNPQLLLLHRSHRGSPRSCHGDKRSAGGCGEIGDGGRRGGASQ